MQLVLKIRAGIKRVKTWLYCHPAIIRVGLFLGLLLVRECAFADGAIPTPDSSDDPTAGNNDFLDILKNIIQKQAGPILVYGGALFFVVLAVFDIYRGYKKYQETDDFGKFKMALVTGAILVVIGLVLFFLGQYILKQWAGS